MKIDIKRRIVSVPTGLVVREIQQNGEGAQEVSIHASTWEATVHNISNCNLVLSNYIFANI